MGLWVFWCSDPHNMTNLQLACLPRAHQPLEALEKLHRWKIPRIFSVFYICHCKVYEKCWPHECKLRWSDICFLLSWKAHCHFSRKIYAGILRQISKLLDILQSVHFLCCFTVNVLHCHILPENWLLALANEAPKKQHEGWLSGSFW